MLQYVIYFVTLMNPVAIFVYLIPLKQQRGLDDFTRILVRASLITFIIYSVFALFGEAIFTEILQVNFRSFQVFGGLVLTGLSFNYLVAGKRKMIKTEGEIYDIAAETALPYMVGTGTITMSILIGRALGNLPAIFTVGGVIAISFAIIMTLALIRQGMKLRIKDRLDQNLQVFMRLNGFFVGAIGVDLIVQGIRGLI